MNIENVRIDATMGLYCIDTDGVTMKNVTITATTGPSMFFYNSQHVSVDGFEYGEQKEPVVRITGSLSNDINFINSGLTKSSGVLIGKDVAEGSVKIENSIN
jgi:hypothetical protein